MTAAGGVAHRAPLLVYGANELAWSVAALGRLCGYEPRGYIDDSGRGQGVVGGLDDALRLHPDCLVAFGIGHGNLQARWRAWQRLKATGRAAPPLVHPRASVADSASLAAGCVVMAGAIIDERVHLGEAVLVWPGACISHDSRIGDNCSICPTVTLCGFVEVGAHSFIGAASVVADRCVVPAGSFLKMQSRYAVREDVARRVAGGRE